MGGTLVRTRSPPFLPFLVLALAASAALAAAPPDSGLEVRAAPARVVLGRDLAVALEVRVPPGAGPVRAAASSGRFAEERLDGGARRTFRWTPPPVRHPLVAVFAFWVEAGDGPPRVTLFRLGLLGQTTLDVATAPGATVEVLLGDKRFGPIQADARGKARVPVEVPPGVVSARVLATRGELRTDAATPLDAPRASPRVAVLTPSPLPAEGGWLFVAGGGPLNLAALELSVEGARYEPVRGGANVARFRVVPVPEATSVTVSVQSPGAEVARTRADVRRVPSRKDLVPVSPLAEEAQGTWRPALQVLAGGSFASGDNTGPFGALGVSLTAPWWNGRFAAELEVGMRGATFNGTVGTLGAVRSQVLAVPVLASVRAEVLQFAAFTLYGRAGGGLAPFRHRLRSDFQAEVKESKLSGMGFLAVQGAYRFGRWSALGEFRGAWAPASTPLLDAQLGGVAALLGMRFEP
ncbi:hypothetical protein [Myxococcus sp. CA056]|uniref:hypothetical protein n=1 Tax=Myxococcus sp. CA056 TaxID=2741740 RepID=UPI001C2CEBA1|nr:hypothetical protein [Myxococcus sp. CA056]